MATLFGRYEYAGELGRGASGRVFAVIDHAASGARRAIKVVPEHDAGRLVWEFARLCQVSHPRIARVRELLRLEEAAAAPFGLGKGTLLLVEDFAEGGQLSSVIGQAHDPRARVELALRVGIGIAEALVALHDVSLVHGDIKPDNVLCDACGEVVTLIDLGFARPPALASIPRGTPAYMAPELFAGVCTPAADVFALGALLYDCLRGEAQTAASSRHTVPWRLFDLRLLELTVPAAMTSLLARLLAPDHSTRPADAHAALALLLSTSSALGLTLVSSSVRYAGLSVVRSPEERAARARTLPFVGQTAELTRLVTLLATAPVVKVRGARGAGRSRLIREAIRVLQEQRAGAGEAVPTWVDSLAGLELLRDVDALLWLEHVERDQLPAIERAAAVAKLAVRSVCVVLECEPGETREDEEDVVELAPLAEPEHALLLERLMAPARPSRDVLAAARQRSLGYAGRLCELVCGLYLAERDLSDARIWLAATFTEDPVVELSPTATEIARALAWWGQAFTPEHAERLSTRASSERAYDELRVKGLLSPDGETLTLVPGLARRLRTELAAAQALWQRLQEFGVTTSSGFALVAAGKLGLASAAFVREGQRLRAEGRSDAACTWLSEAIAWCREPPLLSLLADSERAAGRYADALETLRGSDSDDAKLLTAELSRMTDRAEVARALLDELVQQGEPTSARAHAQRARLFFDAGELEHARSDVDLALATQDREAQVRALEVEVLIGLSRGELPRVPIDRLLASATSSRETDPASFLARAPARAHALRAQVLLRRGERARAQSSLRSAVELSRALGEAHETATYTLNLGLLELESGELGRALETLREAAQRLARVARTRDLARVLFNFAGLALLVGDFERCQVVLAEASRELGNAPDHLVRAYVALVSAELSFSHGALEQAERELENALAELPDSARAARTTLSARAVQVALARGSASRAERYLAWAREQRDDADPSATLELLTAELALALAKGEHAVAEELALRGLAMLGEGSSFSERLRFLLAAIESARASAHVLALAERGALARAWLERALVTLPSELRAKMRAVPAYARVLASGSYERNESDDVRVSQRPVAASERWRGLVRASRRLFVESREARIVARLGEIALELVHAERALVIAFDERGELSVIARSELSSEAGNSLGFSRSVIERVALDRQPLMTVEAGADVRLDRAASVAALQVRSVLCIELFGLRERAFLYLDDRLRPSAFEAEDLALLLDLVELTRQALRNGDELLREGRRARRAELQQKRLSRELARTGDVLTREVSVPLIGDSVALARVITSARRVASSDAPVLITGESGTGKELLARFVHEASPRKTRAFVAESCAAIPDPLLESALFGHVRGAFTGADRAHKGLFEAADGGTLLLDEVGEMSPSLQGKLLRVLQEGELRPLGSERTRSVDVRVIGATRRDLMAMVQTGRFREDLYYRLAVVTLELPPLRERPEDIAQLVTHFLDKHAAGRGVRISPSALRVLEQRAWPGNVRELENEVRRALAFSDQEIDTGHLSSAVIESEQSDTLDLHARTDGLTRKLVREALARAEGNVTRAAVLLGISRFGLQKILKRLQLSAK